MKPNASTSPSELPRRGLRSDCSLHQKGWIRSSSKPHSGHTKRGNMASWGPRKPSLAAFCQKFQVPYSNTPTNPLGVWSYRSKGNLENSFCPIQKSPSFRHAQPVAYPRGKPATWPRLALFCCFIYHLCEDCLISASRPPLQWDSLRFCPGPEDRTFHHLPEAYGPHAMGNAAPLKSTRQQCSAFLSSISDRFRRGILLELLCPSKILTRIFRMFQVPKLFVGTCCSSLAHQDTSRVASIMDVWMFIPIPADLRRTNKKTKHLCCDSQSWLSMIIIHWWFNYFR